MVFLIILGAIFLIYLWILVSGMFANIAEMKGHSGKPYFWFTFFFSIAGMLMVIALPDRKQSEPAPMEATPFQQYNSAPVQPFQPVQPVQPVQTAPAEQPVVPVKKDDANSGIGKAPVTAEIQDGMKVCPNCGKSQKADRSVCWACGQQFDN